MNYDWRTYFSLDELEKAYSLIVAGKDPNDEANAVDEIGSDSCPSDDNLDLSDLYTSIYIRQR